MKKHFGVIVFLFLSAYCFSQQSLPRRIIGQIPAANSAKLYQIQVGAYRLPKNAENAAANLSREGLYPVFEKYFDYTRVLLTGIPASQIRSYLARVRQAGFDEVIIREARDTGNYISPRAAEIPPAEKVPELVPQKAVEKISEAIPQKPVEKIPEIIPEKPVEIVPVAPPPVKAIENVPVIPVPDTSSTDSIYKSWKVMNCTDRQCIGWTIIISDDGTYSYASPDGVTKGVSQWKEYGDDSGKFEFSHDNWRNSGTAIVTDQESEYIRILDPSHIRIIPGFTSAHLNIHYELVPAW